MYRLGLDYHGVCDKYPELFGPLSQTLLAKGDQVYIITGHKNTPEFRSDLEKLGIKYTEIVSVIDYHEKIGSHVWYDERGPWMDADLWNVSKSTLCEKYDIDIMIDDSELYGQYFVGKTKYILLKKG